MLAVDASRFDNDDPLAGVEVGERPDPEVKLLPCGRCRVPATGFRRERASAVGARSRATRKRLAIVERLVVALENASSSLDMSDTSPLAWL